MMSTILRKLLNQLLSCMPVGTPTVHFTEQSYTVMELNGGTFDVCINVFGIMNMDMPVVLNVATTGATNATQGKRQKRRLRQ